MPLLSQRQREAPPTSATPHRTVSPIPPSTRLSHASDPPRAPLPGQRREVDNSLPIGLRRLKLLHGTDEEKEPDSFLDEMKEDDACEQKTADAASEQPEAGYSEEALAFRQGIQLLDRRRMLAAAARRRQVLAAVAPATSVYWPDPNNDPDPDSVCAPAPARHLSYMPADKLVRVHTFAARLAHCGPARHTYEATRRDPSRTPPSRTSSSTWRTASPVARRAFVCADVAMHAASWARVVAMRSQAWAAGATIQRWVACASRGESQATSLSTSAARLATAAAASAAHTAASQVRKTVSVACGHVLRLQVQCDVLAAVAAEEHDFLMALADATAAHAAAIAAMAVAAACVSASQAEAANLPRPAVPPCQDQRHTAHRAPCHCTRQQQATATRCPCAASAAPYESSSPGPCPNPIKPQSPHQREGPGSLAPLVPPTPVTPMWQYSSDLSRPAVPPYQDPAAPPAQLHPPQPAASSAAPPERSRTANPAPQAELSCENGTTLMPPLPQRRDVPPPVLAAQHRSAAPAPCAANAAHAAPSTTSVPRRTSGSTERAQVVSHLRAADLFCGGGGSSLGCEMVPGVEVVAGIDLNGLALRTFELNHPGAIASPVDMHNVAAVTKVLRKAGQIDVIVCSPPCQPHSTSTPASSLIPDDPRAQLTLRAAEVIRNIRPRIAILENVKGLLKNRYGYWKKACKVLRDAGYHIEHEIVNSARLGVPQRRERLIVIATLGRPVGLAAAVALAETQPETTVRDVLPELGDCYWHYPRDGRSSGVRSSDQPSPTLRCNSDHRPAGYLERPSDKGRPFHLAAQNSMRTLATVMGWPSSAQLPVASRRKAMRVLGNSVPPPMMKWAVALAVSALAEDSAARALAAGASTAERLLALQRHDPLRLHRPQEGPSVQQLIQAADAIVDGAYASTLHGQHVTSDPHVLASHAVVPDVDASDGAVHIAQLQRRERRRTSILLALGVASDGTLRSLADPIWSAPPLDAPPTSGNPPAMFAARPFERPSASGQPTHATSRVSAKWKNWQVMHMAHCTRCQQYSEQQLGAPPPLAALRSVWRTGVRPPQCQWQLDPDCYQQAMVDDIRTGFRVSFDTEPEAATVNNGSSCWDEFPQTLEYMHKMDKLGCLSDGVWKLPAGAVCSALHVVARPSDVRAFHRDGTMYPVRTVLDLTKSGVNACSPDWRFRMEGADAAVRMLGDSGHRFLGTTDLSKYYPSLGLHPDTARYCWVKDPRASTVWHGNGPPTAAWLAFQKERRATGKRVPPYRQCLGVPLGLKLAPAFACALSGEMVKYLTVVHGIKCTMYVDDWLCSATTEAQCQAHMRLAEATFEWLGFRTNPDKRDGPAASLKYVGYIFNLDDSTVSIGPSRREELLSLLRRATADRHGNTKDLESLIGKLGFAAGVMRGGRAYIARMRDTFRQARSTHSRTAHYDAGCLADMFWWIRQLEGDWAGSKILLRRRTDELPVVTMKSDASGELGDHHGWGYVFDGALHWARWHPTTVTSTHIQYKELVAICHVAEEYGHQFQNQILRCGVDNSSVAYATNKLSSRCPQMMALLRRIADAQCRHNFDIVCVHVNREFNTLADMCTRWEVPEDFAPHLPHGVVLPPMSSVDVCRHASPTGRGDVFRLALQRRARRAPSQVAALSATAPPFVPRSAPAASPREPPSSGCTSNLSQAWGGVCSTQAT